MKSFAVLAGLVAAVAAQVPSGCSASYNGEFQITTLNATGFVQPSMVKRQDGTLTITLSNGVLTDELGDTGYVASANQQFQFDKPPQAGAIDINNFSACPNNTLAVAGSTIFYSCISGKFSNLYTQSQGAQCSQVFISIIPTSGSGSIGSSSSAPAPATQIGDGQPQAQTAAPAPVTQISDHQPQAATSAPVASPIPVYNSGAAVNGLSNLALAAGALAVFAL